MAKESGLACHFLKEFYVIEKNVREKAKIRSGAHHVWPAGPKVTGYEAWTLFKE